MALHRNNEGEQKARGADVSDVLELGLAAVGITEEKYGRTIAQIARAHGVDQRTVKTAFAGLAYGMTERRLQKVLAEANTNKGRSALRAIRRYLREPKVTPLVALGTWMYSRKTSPTDERCGEYDFLESRHCSATVEYDCGWHQSVCAYHRCPDCRRAHWAGSIRGAPWSLLEAAQLHVEQRLIKLASERKQSSRTRSTERWLGAWMMRIQREMRRRELRVLR